MLGLIMASGSGVLISAVAFELAHESVDLSHGSGMAAPGLFAGAIVFFAADLTISHMCGESDSLPPTSARQCLCDRLQAHRHKRTWNDA